MGHAVKLLVAHPEVLQRYRTVAPQAVAYTLTAGASLAVLPLTDDLQDALHKSYGTGEWWEEAAGITTTDAAFAARASQAGPLALIETDYFGGTGSQCAALWSGGDLVMRTAWLDSAALRNRPRATWPINAALRGLSLAAAHGLDEFDTLGLANYRSNDDVAARALPVRGT